MSSARSSSPRRKARWAGAKVRAPKARMVSPVRGRRTSSGSSSDARGGVLMNSDRTGLGEHEAAHELGMPDRGQEADEGAPRVADEMGRRGAERLQQGGEVVDVGEHRVVGARLDVAVGPGVTAAVGDRAVRRSDRRELLVPAPQIAGAAVDQHDGRARPLLAVRERCPLDRDGPQSAHRRVLRVAGHPLAR